MSMIGVRSGKNPLKEFWPISVLTPAARTAGGNGSNIDRYRNGGYAALTLMLHPGVWTDGTHAFVIEEADDNGSGAPGTYATVAVADLLYDANANAAGGTFTSITAVTTTIQRIDYIGRKRWVRVRNTASGTTTGAVFAVTGLLFSPNILPAA
jgi:hypothetical protein